MKVRMSTVRNVAGIEADPTFVGDMYPMPCLGASAYLSVPTLIQLSFTINGL